MNWTVFFTVFGSIFLAEVADKTQLAVLAYSARYESKLTVFFAAGLALLLATFLGMFFGSLISKFLPAKYVNPIAGVVFIIIGVLLIIFHK